MRSNRRRNWLVKRIALGFAVAAFVAPVAQARVDEGQQVQSGSTAVAYRAFVTDFPSVQSDSPALKAIAHRSFVSPSVHMDVVRADVPGETLNTVQFGMPRAMPSDYALASRDVVRADPPGETVSDIGTIGEPQVVAAGFDWNDAAIGAGLVLGLVLLGGGAALASRQLGKAQTA
jgi:hypothetical protein